MIDVGGGRGGNDHGPSLPGTNAGGFPNASGYPPQVHFWCTFSGPPIANGHTPPNHMLEGMKTYLLSVGYPPKATQEIISASNILASYGVLKPGNIAIFNTPQIQAQTTNPFNTMAGNGNDSIGLGGLNSLGGDGWSNPGMGGGGGGGSFMNKFQQGGGSNRGRFDSSYIGGMDSGLGGAYGKNDMLDLKRRF